jgi:hypothetical protein
VIPSTTPLEQLNITQDETEYMFYSTYNVDLPAGATVWIQGWHANTYSLFVDGKWVGASYDISHDVGSNLTQSITIPSSVAAGTHNITILSGSLGLNNGIGFEVSESSQEKKGIVGYVHVNNNDITSNTWYQRPFLGGEILQVYTSAGASSVSWTPTSGAGVSTPLTWFQTTFGNVPADGGSVLINMNGAGRGHFYINGIDMGRCVVARVLMC